jgi:hypothetical protein
MRDNTLAKVTIWSSWFPKAWRYQSYSPRTTSRIQLALHYKKLSHEQRKQVWRNFFRRLEDLEGAKVNTDNLMQHVEDLADHQMNGREIRNAITIARQLAIYRNQKLDYETLQYVVESTSMFAKYLLELNEGNSGDDIARELGMR